MTGIFGLIGLQDVAATYAYVNAIGQRVVYEATNRYLQQSNEDMIAALQVFVQTTTEDHQERYKLAGGGRLQKRGGQAQSGAVKAGGRWDVGYPLEDFGAQVAATDIAMAYMSPEEYQLHIDTVRIQNQNTVRFELLYALFNNTARSFVDEIWGTLTIQPLANGDAVLYPPVIGSETEAVENHYLESGYAASAIGTTNNPYATIVNELQEDFGESTGGDNIVTFINPAQTALTEAIAGFVGVTDRFIRVGTDQDVPINLPTVPGNIIGRVSGTWVSEWRWMPANYQLGLHLEAPPPLKMRVDPAGTGLGRGLQLVAKQMDTPIESAHWRHRFGFGVGNRLNGVVMELGTGGTYSIPAAYA